MSLTTVKDMDTMIRRIETCNIQEKAKELKSLTGLLSVSSTMRDHFNKVKGVSRILDLLLANDKQIINCALCVLSFSAYNHTGNQLELTTVHVFWLLHNILRQMESHTIMPSIRALILISNIVQGNSEGQHLVRESGCLKYLISTFLSMSQLIGNHVVEDKDLIVTSWRTLCFCITMTVHNPLNVENQQKLREIIPETVTLLTSWFQNVSIKTLLDEFMPDLLSVLSYVLMSNSTNQFYFAASSGIQSTIRCLFVLENWQDLSHELTTIMYKLVQVLNMAINDNVESCKLVGSLGGIPLLLRLLLRLNAELRMSPLMALSSLIGSCKDNRAIFLKENGISTVMFAAKDFRENTDVKALVAQLCEFLTPGSQMQISSPHVHSKRLPMTLCEKESDYHKKHQYNNTTGISEFKLQSNVQSSKSKDNTIDLSFYGASEEKNMSCNSNKSHERGEYLNFKIPLLPPRELGETFFSYLHNRHKERELSNYARQLEHKSKTPGKGVTSQLPGKVYRCMDTNVSGRLKNQSVNKSVPFHETQMKRIITNDGNLSLSRSQYKENIPPMHIYNRNRMQSEKSSSNETTKHARNISSHIYVNKVAENNKIDKVHKSKQTIASSTNCSEVNEYYRNNYLNQKMSTPKSVQSNTLNNKIRRSENFKKMPHNICCNNKHNFGNKELKNSNCCNRETLLPTPIIYNEENKHTFQNTVQKCSSKGDKVRYINESTKRKNVTPAKDNETVTKNYKCSVSEQPHYSEEELRNLVAGVKKYGFDFKAIHRTYKFHRKRTPKDLYHKWRSSFITKEEFHCFLQR